MHKTYAPAWALNLKTDLHQGKLPSSTSHPDRQGRNLPKKQGAATVSHFKNSIQDDREVLTMRLVSRVRSLAAGAAAIGICAFGAASPATAELDFTGKTVDFVIPFAESGGSAKWANF
jgi:hypothetical protein